MLKAMRRSVQSTFVKIFLFGLLIVSFGLWGVTDVFFSSPESRVVAEVDGEELDFTTYFDRYQQMLRRTGMQQAGVELDASSGEFIEQLVLDDWAFSVAIDREVKALRLAVTDTEVRDEIRRDPTFRDTEGNFSRSRFEAFLARSGLSEQNYLRTLRRDILQNQLISSLLKSTPTPQAQAALLHEYGETYRSSLVIEILATPFMENLPEANEQALLEHYNAHQESFREPETRQIGIIDLSLDRVASSFTVEETELQTYYDEHRSSYSLPERRTIERILFTNEAKAREAWLALQEGKDFFAVAKTFADADRESVQLGEILHENYTDSQLADKAFRQKVGEPSEPFEGLFGWMIVRVTDVKEAEEPSLAEIRETLERELRRDRAVDKVFDFVIQVEDLLAGGATLQEISQEIEFPLRLRDVVMLDDDESTPALLRSQVLSLTEQDARQLFEDDTGGYRLLELLEVRESFIPDFEEIRQGVQASWSESHQRQEALKQASVLADRVNAGEDFAELAEELLLLRRRTEAVNREGRSLPSGERDNFAVILPESAHLAALFTLKPGVALALPSELGARVMVLEEEIVQDAPADNPDFRNMLANASYFGFVDSLRRKYPIQINREALDYVYDVLNGGARQRLRPAEF